MNELHKNIRKAGFPPGGILRAERMFSLSFLFHPRNHKTKKNSAPRAKFRLMENRLNSSTHSQSSEKENRTKICSKNCNVISTDQILMHCLC